MNYPGTQYTFSPEHGVHIGHEVHYPQHTSQPQHLDRHFLGHSHSDFADFAHHASMMDEYDEGAEPSTRPRLTKDQVDVLESQFKAQPKPNSNVKRQLAVQTNLTLPRVAVSSPNILCNFKTDLVQNWFQNRRAKAKQQKKQEEFEIKRTLGFAEGWKSESSLPSGCPLPIHLNTAATSAKSD